jgi:hypothetical protein
MGKKNKVAELTDKKIIYIIRAKVKRRQRTPQQAAEYYVLKSKYSSSRTWTKLNNV